MSHKFEPKQTAPKHVVETAKAKINLALHITGRRDDGYHLLDSLVVFTQFGDELTLSATTSGLNEFEISGPFAVGLKSEPDNLILQAHAALGKVLNTPLPATRFHLTKNLPIASGIGGGSANAAAALRGLVKLWNIEISHQTLLDVALNLGADVPVCLASSTCRMRGIGEVIDPIENFTHLYMILVNCGAHISTPKIFNALALPKNKNAFGPLASFDSVSSFDGWINWLNKTRNDMQACAIEQSNEIAETLDMIERTENLKFSRMSGSGATCFGLYESFGDAQNAVENIAREKPNWWIVVSD